jgi:hypothetical protein
MRKEGIETKIAVDDLGNKKAKERTVKILFFRLNIRRIAD